MAAADIRVCWLGSGCLRHYRSSRCSGWRWWCRGLWFGLIRLLEGRDSVNDTISLRVFVDTALNDLTVRANETRRRKRLAEKLRQTLCHADQEYQNLINDQRWLICSRKLHKSPLKLTAILIIERILTTTTFRLQGLFKTEDDSTQKWVPSHTDEEKIGNEFDWEFEYKQKSDLVYLMMFENPFASEIKEWRPRVKRISLSEKFSAQILPQKMTQIHKAVESKVSKKMTRHDKVFFGFLSKSSSSSLFQRSMFIVICWYAHLERWKIERFYWGCLHARRSSANLWDFMTKLAVTQGWSQQAVNAFIYFLAQLDPPLLARKSSRLDFYVFARDFWVIEYSEVPSLIN